MGKFKVLSLALITGLSLSACSSSNAETTAPANNVESEHTHMDKIEQRSCCDE